MSLRLTLEEISDGIEKTIKVKRFKSCSSCSGSGAKAGSGHSACPHCNGTGEIRQTTRSIFGQFVNVSECPYCGGEGKIVKDKCTECEGSGRTKSESTIKVNIPPGVVEGNYIPLRGQGHSGIRGGSSGDLYVYIEEEEHEHFIRNNDDVIHKLEISFFDAVLGAEIIVPTLSGKAKLKIDPGTQSGSILKMKEKGIRHLNSYGRGDQLNYISVYTPKKISSKEKEMMKELSKSENFKPSGKTKKDKGFFNNMFG